MTIDFTEINRLCNGDARHYKANGMYNTKAQAEVYRLKKYINDMKEKFEQYAQIMEQELKKHGSIRKKKLNRKYIQRIKQDI